MKLFYLLIFCLISASVRADEEVTTVEDIATPTEPIFNINQEETTTVGKIFELNGNEEFEDSTTEPVAKSEDFPDETTTTIPGTEEDNDGGVMLPDQLPTEEPRAEEPLTTEESLNTDTVTLAEQDGTTVIIPAVRSEDGNAPTTETDGSTIPTLRPEVKDNLLQILRSFLDKFRNGKPMNWEEISSAVEPLLRGGDISNDQAGVMKELANRFLEIINRASADEKAVDVQSFTQVLSKIPREAIDRMVKDKSIGLTPNEGSLIKDFYDKAVSTMGEMKIELTTTPQTIITEQLPEIIPEEKIPEQAQEKEADSTTVSPGTQEEPKESSTKPELKEDQLNSERSESHDESESKEMDKDKLILLITVAAACSLLLLCGGMGLCCYMRKRGRSGRSNFKA